jgi:uncharacterized protein (TIGR02996 family)
MTKKATKQDNAMLAAIVAAPDDDAPRLVYADWLTERGDPRGEFIQVQIARARLAPKDWAKDVELEEKEDTLHRAHRKTWEKAWSGLELIRVVYRRGFPERIGVSGGDFQDQREEILKAFPLLRGVEIEEASAETIAWLGETKGRLDPLRELVLTRPEAEPKVLHKLVGSNAIANLDTLEMNECLIFGGQGIATALAKNKHAANLHTLRFDDVFVGSVGLGVLLQAKTMPKLRTLAMLQANVQDKGADLIAKKPVAQLRRFELSFTDFTPKSFRAVMTSELMGKLEHFAFHDYIWKSRGPVFAASSKLKNLRVLDLESASLDEAAARALTVAEMPKLELLRVDSRAEGRSLLAQRFGGSLQIC